MEGEEPIQPARCRRGIEGVEAQPGELGAGTGDATRVRASGDAQDDQIRTINKTPLIMPYKIRVYDLNDQEQRRDPKLPCLHVRIDKFDRTGTITEKTFPDWVVDAKPVERPDLSVETSFHKIEKARKRMSGLVEKLSARGHTVNRCKTVYRLYVIELEPNIKKDGEALAVYVGETSKSREKRFEEHMAGGKLASRHVSKRGVRLRPDLTPRQEYYTRKASKGAELRLADRLREKGFAVYGGH